MMKSYFNRKVGTVDRGHFVSLSRTVLKQANGPTQEPRKRAWIAMPEARHLAMAAVLLGVFAPCQVSHAVTATAGGTILGRQPSAQSSGLGIDILGIPTGIDAPTSPEPDYGPNRAGPGVYLGTGQVVWEETDLFVKGRDSVTDLVIKRRHLTGRNYPHSIFGHAWSFNYDHTLQRDDKGDVVMESFGRTDYFTNVTTDTVWEGKEGRFGRLTYAAGYYHLRMPHGTVLEFTAVASGDFPAHLTKITSPKGNTLVFNYETDADPLMNRKLTSIVDSYGRTYQFTYTDTDTPHAATSIVDFSNREVSYLYNKDGQLESVRSPLVTSTGGFNNFALGKFIKYKYRGHSNLKLQNALTEVIYPNQAASQLPRAQFTYDEVKGSNPYFGYLKTYTLGNTNATPELKAGGVFSYDYRALDSQKTGLSEPFREVTVVDRAGTTILYKVNRLGQVLEENVQQRGLRAGSQSPFSKSYRYNSDGQLTEAVAPSGRKTGYLYLNRRDEPANKNKVRPRTFEFSMTDRVVAPDTRGADQRGIKERVIYEPIFNMPHKTISSRGFDDAERMNNESDISLRARFTTTFLFDYMEDLTAAQNEFAPLLGLSVPDLEALLTAAGVTDASGPNINGDGINDQRQGNVIKIQHPTVSLPTQASRITGLGTTQQAEEILRYNALGQLTYHRDAEENVTTHEYFPAQDPDGDTQNIISGMDTVTGGYLKRTIKDALAGGGRNTGRDPTPVAQTTSYAYAGQGVRGTPTSIVDPRGITTGFLVNELDQIIVVTNTFAVPSGLIAFAYKSITIFDANNNVIETRTQNKDDLDQTDDFIIHTNAYDILDQKRLSVQDHGLGVGYLKITSAYAYDANQNLIFTTNAVGKPEQAVEARTYDERDFVVSRTRGLGAAEASTITTEIDANGNIVKHIDAAPDVNSGETKHDVTTYVYDGFDRQREVVDRVGNRTMHTYDSASNLLTTKKRGPADDIKAEKVLLAQTDNQYDSRNRAFRTDRHLFHYPGKEVGTIKAGSLDPGDKKVTTITLYDRLSRVVGSVDADDDLEKTVYDGLSRVLATIDPIGNYKTNTYDLNNNVVSVLRFEKTKDGSGALITEQFVNTFTYDSLNRNLTSVEPNTQTTTYAYDSRNNMIKVTDHLGNETDMRYDRLDRKIRTAGYLSPVDATTGQAVNASANTADVATGNLMASGLGGSGGAMGSPGQGGGDGKVEIIETWDDLDRKIMRTDDRGNTTTNIFDDLDRKIRVEYADGTKESWVYNADGEMISHTNQNGAVEMYDYDAKSRPTRMILVPPPAQTAVGTTEKKWGYDGLDRVTMSFDNNASISGSETDDDVKCEFIYDSLSRKICETQQIGGEETKLSVEIEWEGEDRKVSETYPNGRKILRDYDELDRLVEIKEATNTTQVIASFEYIGPDRDLKIEYGNGAVLDKRNDAKTSTITGAGAGYDNNRRDVRHEWKTSDAGSVITCYTNSYNGTGGIGTNHRKTETRLHLDDRIDTYTLDAKYRLVAFGHEESDPSGNTITNNSTRLLDGVDRMVSYIDEGLDRKMVVDDPTTTADDGEVKMNQYVSVDDDERRFDDNGNLDDTNTDADNDDAADEAQDLEFDQDYQNRICEVKEGDGDAVATYVYDAKGRRVLKKVMKNGVAEVTRFLYDGHRVVEERDGVDATDDVKCQFVDGRGMDEHLQMVNETKDDDSDGKGDVSYYHSNAQGFVGAMTDAKGDAVEFYEYDMLGEEKILDENKIPLTDSDSTTRGVESKTGNPYAFQGRRMDPETKLYYFRSRFYNADLGEFLTVDTKGNWSQGQGNGYSALGENPLDEKDPLGMDYRVKELESDYVGEDRDNAHWNDFFAKHGRLGGYGETVTADFYFSPEVFVRKDVKWRTRRGIFAGTRMVPQKRNVDFSVTTSRGQVKYFNNEEREHFRITVQDGLLYRNGVPFHTMDAGRNALGSHGVAIFVMDGQGNIFASKVQRVGVIHHSTLLGGQAVAAAGEMKVNHGRLEFINNKSGHYKPDAESLDQLISELQGRNVNLEGAEKQPLGQAATRIDTSESLYSM